MHDVTSFTICLLDILHHLVWELLYVCLVFACFILLNILQDRGSIVILPIQPNLWTQCIRHLQTPSPQPNVVAVEVQMVGCASLVRLGSFVVGFYHRRHEG